ncbi:hypothetical protein H4219_005145 [Mycoemilia scoparia]|uniref:Uncharacterized protein n=1 Tax=Mycoemilia scoparia TaxID=417184 RepID=A0A9W8DQ38_9FUNG|nr:hypothetical protein H4219_005145 [Mycoemilia scoparia]
MDTTSTITTQPTVATTSASSSHYSDSSEMSCKFHQITLKYDDLFGNLCIIFISSLGHLVEVDRTMPKVSLDVKDILSKINTGNDEDSSVALVRKFCKEMQSVIQNNIEWLKSNTHGLDSTRKFGQDPDQDDSSNVEDGYIVEDIEKEGDSIPFVTSDMETLVLIKI